MAEKNKNTGSSEDQMLISNKKLFADVSHLIEQSRQQVAMQANSTLTILFWQVGKRINDDILQNQRAEYGKQILPTLSAKLENLYGRNFTEKNIRRMVRFSEQFPDIEIVVPLSRQLTWSHFIEFFSLKSNNAKQFYAQLAINNMLGVRELRKQIANKAFERTAIANIQAAQNENMLINTFKDPNVLDFLGLTSGYLKKILKQLSSVSLKNSSWNWEKDLLLLNARKG
ncbi:MULTISPECIES: DUF1016 N-terminal domain-containing protein [Chryseobacterium]|uniref:YhcG N-terminal domain-containing protein n=1 Tax=Chryseobacterium camelliae TaxID=1265445 RepID=A0ABU0TGS3_9FLAO|nr:MULTISPECIES: DUF1016 N-terminal domain-containing protein [Chryseobacterium]MDT3406862.1 hypothetical protein [Pseudacidovorax intermedius]MDQ1095343.1 hypothetical protein [Chryseobacterium camelliae]MDQ1099281.1 hypothetical protein [Chryseobacterium sp. SORGH_AS_1048]MDR6086630.1 hypothetical protein [Chryseobacterium sp. SORGH_AS_0909]MDR6131002.1 hypothetical protein [Chryseobacterium sp. SORGH_AS_1175]